MTAANAVAPGARRGLVARWRALDARLRTFPLACALAPVQLGLRCVPFFVLPFVASGLTKWQVLPFLKPEPGAWSWPPELAAGPLYQFSQACEFCFNIRILGDETAPLVQWVLPFPAFTTAMAGLMEIVLPTLILLGLFTRLSALGLLGMTIVIQLVLPTGWPVHVVWAAVLLAILALGPGLVSLDGLLLRGRAR